MPRRRLGRRSVRPVFGDRLLPIGETRTDLPNRLSLIRVLEARVRGWRGWTKLIRTRQGKWRYQPPVWREERLCNARWSQERLPSVWIDELGRRIDWYVSGVVRIWRAAVHVPTLIRSIGVPPFENGGACQIADAFRR
jgi:hypothetical protein